VVTPTEQAAGRGDHVVVFYRSDLELIEAAGRFLRGPVTDGGARIVIATAAHRASLRARLAAAGTDPAIAAATGSYAELDAGDTLGRCMINGWPDPAAFWQLISPLMEQCGRGGRPVRVFGEMAGLLWGSGQAGATIDLEALWNELAARYSFSLLCGYRAETAASLDVSDALTQVCGAHTATVGEPPELGLALRG
jgi:DcmR-like sensory protein